MKRNVATLALVIISNFLVIPTVLASEKIVHLSSAEVSVKDLKTSGSGCPYGTVSGTIAPDGKSFVLGFDEYTAEVGPSIPRRENRKTCQITAVLEIPNGLAFTIADVNYRGYASLDSKVKALQSSSYFFAGNRQESRLNTEFHGPIEQNYTISDRLGLESLVWSSCNAMEPVVIKTELRVDNQRNRRKSGLITLDTIDGKVTHSYGLMFKKC
ncbi:DUF4360 domain-containing protein [Vibrio sp. S4M6]|uniref:DUF4360 domain-containing protein n=1 Tax=Vibrio sinus TaxID=2946865 RepID=UPI00202A6BF9|nr:DUF4360 domain-containing protein [Vibrio sinus]MCL9780711.1 DUF4360 domain-containing protein [Vibrio sinus]